MQRQLQLLTIFTTHPILGFWFWIYQASEYAKVAQSSEYAWICPNMLAFVLFPHCNHLFPGTCGYLFQCLYETSSYSLKECEVVFWKRQNFDFFFLFNCWIWLVFCFRLKTFARFQIFARFLRHWNTGLVSSSASLTSWGDGASLALADHPSSDCATIKIPYEVDVLHRPALHSIFLYWVG